MSESSIVRPTIDALNALGPDVMAWRVHSGKVKVRRGWMQLAPAGCPDVHCLVKGRLVLFELKDPDAKKVSFEASQLPWHAKAIRAGAVVSVVQSAGAAVSVVKAVLENER